MLKPNYKDGSIVNLMSSIMLATGGKPLYEPLQLLDPEELAASKNIVLMVLDGLGYEQVIEYGDSTFKKFLRGKMTAVFPPTTAASVTTFLTGVAPQQHAFTGWYIYFKELGIVTVPLMFVTKKGKVPLWLTGLKMRDLFKQKTVFEKIKSESYVIMPAELANSEYTRATTIGAKVLPYAGINGLFRQTTKAVRSKGKKLVYAYWPGFDASCHEFGCRSKKTTRHFKELNKRLKKFLTSLKGTNTTVIITADHGLIDTAKSRRVFLNKHPKLMETLVMPLSGDSRAAYCYVRPDKTKQFEKYVRTKLKKYFWLFKSKDLVKRGLFGTFGPNQRLFERIGDYTLIAKSNYTIKDSPPGEDHFLIGTHSGLTERELFVPLIVVKC